MIEVCGGKRRKCNRKRTNKKMMKVKWLMRAETEENKRKLQEIIKFKGVINKGKYKNKDKKIRKIIQKANESNQLNWRKI